MKNPWLTFAGICSLGMGIVLFSIVFGGYSSFLRSQNRIETAKKLLIDQCRSQLGMVETLASLPDSVPESKRMLLEAVENAAGVLERMGKSDSPVAREVIAEYEEAQVRVNGVVDTVLESAPENEIQKQLDEAKTAIFIAGKRYNKEALYFNTRIRVFPGFIVAKLFGLDEIHFNEIALDGLIPRVGKEVAGAS